MRMKHIFYRAFVLLSIGGLVGACNTDNDTNFIENSILGAPHFSPLKDSIPLEYTNIKVNAIQGNSLNNYQLGQITQNELGTTNISFVSQVSLSTLSPTFGEKSASQEASSYNENETVEKVYLYLPFHSTEQTTRDGNNQTVKTYKLDSIYGNKNAHFTLSVEELNYHLRDINSNLENQIYFSDQQTPTSTSLASTTIEGIKNDPIIRRNFDDPTTSDDESTKEKDRLAPGIRIELATSIFQSYLINNEGSDILSNNSIFAQHLKGIVVSTSNFSTDLLALLNLKNAKIEVVYTYLYQKDSQNYTKRKSYELTLGNIIFNKYNVSNNTLSLSQDFLYLKGGVGYVAEINIPNDNSIFQTLKTRKPLINQADLFLYVDKTKVNENQQPSYVIAYNAEQGIALADYYNDLSNNSNQLITSIGKLEKDSAGEYFYRIRITDYLTNVIKGNTNNIKIGLAVSSHLASSSRTVLSALTNIKYKNASNEVKNTVLGDAENSLFTVIYGNSSNVPEAKKLKLKVYYTLTR